MKLSLAIIAITITTACADDDNEALAIQREILQVQTEILQKLKDNELTPGEHAAREVERYRAAHRDPFLNHLRRDDHDHCDD